MAIALVTKFQPYVDEQFATESRKMLLTNQYYDWSGAHSIKLYKITTASMNDYGRSGPSTGKTGPDMALYRALMQQQRN